MKSILLVITLCLRTIPYSFSVCEGLNPAKDICACPGETLIYTCTVDGRVTIWRGTAFDCAENSDVIQFLHSNFDNAKGECNDRDILGQSVDVNGICYTSQLNVTISAGLNNKTVVCNSDMHQIGTSLITVTDACQQAPPGVSLTDVCPGKLIFSWSRLSPDCMSEQYIINSDCGNCSKSVSADTSATCSNLQVSETARNCTFSVGSVIRGFSGPTSNPITVMLKVPNAPQVNFMPVYSSDSQTLIRLIVEIIQIDSFLISKGISGSVVNYIIHFSSGTINTIPANCTGSVCKNMVEVRPPTVCQSSNDDSIISASAVNRLGPGQPSQPVAVGCTNRFVTVDIDSAASTLTCRFQNNQNTVQKTCSVEYSLCSQEQVLNSEGNSTLESPDKVTLSLSSLSSSDCYIYKVRASDGTSTVMVEGRMDPDEGSSSAVIAAAVVVPIICVLIIAIVVVSVVLFIWMFHFRRKEYHASSAVTASSEGTVEITLTSDSRTNDTKDDTTNEPDYHRGDADHSEKEPEYVIVVQVNKGSDSVDGGENGLESSDGNAEHWEDKNKTTDSGDVGVKAVKVKFDEEHELY